MKRALLVAAAVAAALAAAGACTKHQTEMILYVTTEGVRIPDDVGKLHVIVQDRAAAGDDTIYEQDVVLCNASLSTGCYDVPVTAVLFPGKSRGNDSVRVQINAIGSNGVVIADAALFTFADEQSLRLDFVLYANCLGNVECAKRDQACGPLDTCIHLHPTSGGGVSDFARPGSPPDLSASTPPDLTPVDLAGADLYTPPPDLTTTIDLAGCAAVMCDMGEQCIAGVCQACGGAGQPCCFGPTAPPPQRPNAGGTMGGGTCGSTNLVCNGSTCEVCGNLGQLCCGSPNTPCNAGVCNNGTCQPQSMPDMMMSPGNMSIGMAGGPDLF